MKAANTPPAINHALLPSQLFLSSYHHVNTLFALESRLLATKRSNCARRNEAISPPTNCINSSSLDGALATKKPLADFLGLPIATSDPYLKESGDCAPVFSSNRSSPPILTRRNRLRRPGRPTKPASRIFDDLYSLLTHVKCSRDELADWQQVAPIAQRVHPFEIHLRGDHAILSAALPQALLLIPQSPETRPPRFSITT